MIGGVNVTNEPSVPGTAGRQRPDPLTSELGRQRLADPVRPPLCVRDTRREPRKPILVDLRLSCQCGDIGVGTPWIPLLVGDLEPG